MVPALKAELRKLLSVRSTYGWILAAYAFLVFIALYGEGYRSGAASVSGPSGALFLAGSIVTHANLLSIFGAIVALLLMTHEYRYNTIIYTLTAANSRSKVLASKIITVLLFVTVYATVGVAIGLVCMLFGMHLAGHNVPHQDISLLTYLGKSIFFCAGWALAALLIATLLRNQVAALVVLLVVPNTIESLLGLVLRSHAVYLPFTALQQVISPPVLAGSTPAHEASRTGSLSPMKGACVFGIYLLVGWIITWLLFCTRDAS